MNNEEGLREAWESGCKQVLKDLAYMFNKPENMAKVSSIRDREVFVALGQTIEKFPIPEFHTVLFSLPDAGEENKKLKDEIQSLLRISSLYEQAAIDRDRYKNLIIKAYEDASPLSKKGKIYRLKLSRFEKENNL